MFLTKLFSLSERLRDVEHRTVMPKNSAASFIRWI